MKELGEQVFLTGQAVKNRVEQLEDMGILKRYTINIDCLSSATKYTLSYGYR